MIAAKKMTRLVMLHQKGRVGKTLSINLACCLARASKRTRLTDLARRPNPASFSARISPRL
jgi:cellulose biosynthesis protein BcsQ